MVGVVVVDGTGTDITGWQNDEQYEIDYGNSHCSKIQRRFASATYQRGPTADGLDMGPIIQKAISNCHSFAAAQSCSGLILVGHSRGAAALIAAAHKLQEDGIEVDFMGLFDAVEMDVNTSYDVDYIPANVKAVRHGERQFTTGSRPWWGNCGDAWGGGANFRRSFWGTHGCLGGVPPKLTKENGDTYIDEAFNSLTTWVTVKDGNIASWMIADWINQGIDEAYAQAAARNPKDWKRGDYGKPSTWVPPGGGYVPPPPPGNGNGGGVGGGNGGGSKTHIVKSGESLSLISGNYWGDVLLWPILHDANKATVPDFNKIYPNQKLVVPNIGGYSKPELDAARARGRNW